jgi:hypothetical protein
MLMRLEVRGQESEGRSAEICVPYGLKPGFGEIKPGSSHRQQGVKTPIKSWFEAAPCPKFLETYTRTPSST